MKHGTCLQETVLVEANCFFSLDLISSVQVLTSSSFSFEIFTSVVSGCCADPGWAASL